MSKDAIREAAEKAGNQIARELNPSLLLKFHHLDKMIGIVEPAIRAVVERDRDRCINEIEAMRDCYNTNKTDEAIRRIRQGGES